MTRHGGVRLIGALVATAALGLLGLHALPDDAPAGAHRAVAAGRPNIVLITTDDQNASDMRWMPKTRRLLAAQGVTFTDSVSPHPLCCPARASILTGQYAQNNGVRGNVGPHGGIRHLDNAHTLPLWLEAAGYRTAFVGKYLNGYENIGGRQPGWDIFNPTLSGVYHYEYYTMFDNGSPIAYRGAYITDTVSADTARYIRQLSGAEPFFIWASYVAPHNACRPSQELSSCNFRLPVPAAKYAHVLSGARTPAFDDPSYNESDVRDKPPAIRRLGPVSSLQMAYAFQARIRALQSVDDAVAGTVRTLAETGQLANTLLIFTSDNGYMLGEHRTAYKNKPYEPAMRVPMILRGPGVPQGVARHQTVATIDIAPTVVQAAGANPDLVMDGQSMLPLAAGTEPRRGGDLVIQAGAVTRDDPYGWLYRGIRTPRYTYVRWPAARFVELYDRRVDPAELRNVARAPRYAGVRKALAARAAVLERCSGAACRTRSPAMPQLRVHRTGSAPPPPPVPGRVARVVRVRDAETLVVQTAGGGRRVVRLLDVISPVPGREPACGATAAARALRRLLPPGTTVWLGGDRREPRVDRRHRLLRYVVRRADHLHVNLVQLEDGWAQVRSYRRRPFDRFNLFASAQHDAMQQDRGLWVRCWRPGPD